MGMKQKYTGVVNLNYKLKGRGDSLYIGIHNIMKVSLLYPLLL